MICSMPSYISTDTTSVLLVFSLKKVYTAQFSLWTMWKGPVTFLCVAEKKTLPVMSWVHVLEQDGSVSQDSVSTVHHLVCLDLMVMILSLDVTMFHTGKSVSLSLVMVAIFQTKTLSLSVITNNLGISFTK